MVQIIPQTGLGELLGGGFGTGFQSGVKTGLQFLVKGKLQQMKARTTLAGLTSKNVENLPKYLNSYLSNLKKEEYGQEDRENILKFAEPMVKKGMSLYDALSSSVRMFENPEDFAAEHEAVGIELPEKKEEKKGFPAVKEALSALSAVPGVGGLEAAGLFFGEGLKKKAPKVPEALEALTTPPEALPEEAAPKEQVTRKVLRKTGESLKKATDYLFGIGGQPSKEELEKISEKVKSEKTSAALSDYEITHSIPQDYDDYPEEEKEKVRARQKFAFKKAEAASKASAVPFIGTALAERSAEAMGVPFKAPPIAHATQMAAELPLLGGLLGGPGTSLPMQAVRGAATFGGARAAEEAIKVAGTKKPADLDAIAIDTAIGGLFPYAIKGISKLGKPLIKATKSLMGKLGVTAGEAAERITKEAVKEGVNLERVAAGEAAEVKEARVFADRIAKVEKPTVKEIKPVRAFEEMPKIAPKEEAKVFEKQVKLYDKLEGEIKEDAAAIEKRLARTKLPTTLAKEENLKKVAGEVIPKLKEDYGRLFRNRAALEDELRTLSKEAPEYERLKSLVEFAKEEEKAAEEALKNSIYQANTGALRPTSKDINIQISDALKKLKKSSLNPEKEVSDLVKTYNPERVKKGERLLKKKPLPGEVYEDTYSKVMNKYVDAFEKEAATLRKELKDPKTVLGLPPNELKAKQKELEALEKMIKRDKANVAIHEREKGLRKIGERRKIKEKIKAAKPTEAPKIEKIAKEKINVQEVNKGKNEAKRFDKPEKMEGPAWEKATDKVGITDPKEKASLSGAIGDLKDLSKGKKKSETFDEFRRRNKKVMTQLLKPVHNQLIAGFVLGLVDHTTKELTGSKIPSTLKLTIYTTAGIGTKRATAFPILAATTYFTDLFLGKGRVKWETHKLSELRGKEYLKEVEKLKKGKYFTPEQKKEIIKKSREKR